MALFVSLWREWVRDLDQEGYEPGETPDPIVEDAPPSLLQPARIQEP